MKRPFIYLAVGLIVSMHLGAQDAFGTTGGDTSGSTGSEAFSAGLLVYTEITGPGGSATQGIQFSHELYVINVREDIIGISLNVYPNPSSDQLMIQLIGRETYDYQMFNSLGMKLLSGKVLEGVTQLQVADLPAGLYLLDILQKNKSIKTYKIIKN